MDTKYKNGKARLDQELVRRGLVRSRSQAESYIKLGEVKVGGKVVTKPGHTVGPEDPIELIATEQYVSRAALKLDSVAQALKLDFRGAVVLDVGSSTGGFTDYALRHGAAGVIAVEIGRDQLHPSLRSDRRIELHERTDIRDVKTLSRKPDIVLADVSFISLREILPHVAKLCSAETAIAVMVKPQFEAAKTGNLKHKGVIKNDAMRRAILKDFEGWARQHFVVLDKADSSVSGAKGNRERFYLLRKLPVAR
jgi:23S rRNA (cytidine1920-2'-O)/16S rRNA (cytidine1409-2'-O)-methyltransferase